MRLAPTVVRLLAVDPSKRRLVGVLLLVGAVLAACWFVLGRELRLPSAPLANAPRDVSAVARVNVGAVVDSPLWQRFVVARGGARGLERITSTCGFNPLEQLEDVVVFITGTEASLDHVGFVGRGGFDREALAACVSEVVQEGGGTIERQDIEGVPAVRGGRGDTRAAFIGTRGVAWGTEETVRGVIRTVRGDEPSAAEHPVLARLWERVAPGRDAVVVAEIPQRWREAAQRTVEAASDEGALALAQLRGVGLGVRLRSGFGAGLLLEMADTTATLQLVGALEARLAQALDNPMMSLSAAGPALRAIEIEGDGRDVVVTVNLPEGRFEAILGLVDELVGDDVGGQRPGSAPPQYPGLRRDSPPRPPVVPDEVLRPRP